MFLASPRNRLQAHIRRLRNQNGSRIETIIAGQAKWWNQLFNRQFRATTDEFPTIHEDEISAPDHCWNYDWVYQWKALERITSEYWSTRRL